MLENIFNLSIFKGIDRNTIEKIIFNCKEKNYKDQEKILIEGDDSNGEGYIIKFGSVIVSIKGREIATLSAGDIFGEIALLNEEERTATVTSKGEITVLILHIDDLINMLNNDDNSINKTIMNRIKENLEKGN